MLALNNEKIKIFRENFKTTQKALVVPKAVVELVVPDAVVGIVVPGVVVGLVVPGVGVGHHNSNSLICFYALKNVHTPTDTHTPMFTFCPKLKECKQKN